jgi:hypothetical protein
LLVSRKPIKRQRSIAIELFDRIEEYADELQEKAEDEEPALGSGTSIIVFCENFFAQFFRSFLGIRITGMSSRSKMVAARQRRNLSAEKHQATRQLIAQFENLCDLWPDLLGSRYAHSSTLRTEFNISFLPTLFKRIISWAEERGEERIVQRAREAALYYTESIEGLANE